jgi:hypothetical protein
MNMTTPIWNNSFVRSAFPPSVVHFLGPVKPWSASYMEDHPARGDMLRYLAASPWPNFVAHPTFELAWQMRHPNLSGSPPPTKFRLSRSADVEGMIALLKRTSFADVEQGISPFHRNALSPSHDP